MVRSTAKSQIGRKLRRSAKKVALNTAKNLIETGDINKTLQKSVNDSKKEVENALKSSKDSRKRKLSILSRCKTRKYNFMK